jgi:hypothetical protein
VDVRSASIAGVDNLSTWIAAFLPVSSARNVDLGASVSSVSGRCGVHAGHRTGRRSGRSASAGEGDRCSLWARGSSGSGPSLVGSDPTGAPVQPPAARRRRRRRGERRAFRTCRARVNSGLEPSRGTIADRSWTFSALPRLPVNRDRMPSTPYAGEVVASSDQCRSCPAPTSATLSGATGVNDPRVRTSRYAHKRASRYGTAVWSAARRCPAFR